MTVSNNRTRDERIRRLKSSGLYKDFREIVRKKSINEDAARTILINNRGRLQKDDIRQMFMLIDEPYPYHEHGKLVRRPWFGRLIKPNALRILNEDELRINQWFHQASDELIAETDRIDILRMATYKIKGLDVGFITLIFYLMDKQRYLIWFKSLHEGLRMIYPDIEKFNGKSNQYVDYNRKLTEFAMIYGFDHTELDWVLSTGLLKC